MAVSRIGVTRSVQCIHVMASVDEIKQRVNISELIEQYVHLQKAGQNYKGLCPFHNERTPSFSVSEERQMFYCFGCGAGGDVVDFVQRIEGLDFTGAMTLLAERVGLTFETGSPEVRQEQERLYEVMEAACLYYQAQLDQHTEARSYLFSRGVGDASIQVWRLGFAPGPDSHNAWRSLKAHLEAKGYDEELLVSAGLIKDPRDEGRSKERFDTFRDRIIFPIRDIAGRVVGFSGRLLSEKNTGATNAPKYLNSPDTPIFHKSSLLYGLDHAKRSIRTMDFSVIVEGQMDLILSHQRGFQNTVATSGTAVTHDHLTRLSRLSPRVMLAFDADEAGVQAVQKTAALALSLSMDVKVAITPPGKDPADILMSDPSTWKQVLKEGRHVIMFLLDHATKDTSDKRETVQMIQRDVLPFVAALQSRSEQSYFVSEIASATGIREQALWDDLAHVVPPDVVTKGVSTDERVDTSDRATHNADTASVTRKERIVSHLTALLSWQQQAREPEIDAVSLERSLRDRIGENQLHNYIHAAADNNVFRVEQTYAEGELTERVIADLLRELDIVLLEEQGQEARERVVQAERAGDNAAAKTALKEVQDIQTQIDGLRAHERDNEHL